MMLRIKDLVHVYRNTSYYTITKPATIMDVTQCGIQQIRKSKGLGFEEDAVVTCLACLTVGP